MLSDAERNYTWNAENRLILEEPRNPSDGKKAEFLYDYMGHRVRKRVFTYAAGIWEQESEKLFVYDGWNLIEEITVSGDVTAGKYYVWGLDLSQTLQGAGGIGGLLCSVDNAGNTLYYLYDGNGNVGQLVKPDGSIAAHYEYDPFGNQLVADGTEAEDNPFRFSTKYYDAETGLFYYGFRYYSPEIGRWLNRDPIGEDGSLLLYLFLCNSPNNAIDPLGLIDWKLMKEVWREDYESGNMLSRATFGLNRPTAILYNELELLTEIFWEDIASGAARERIFKAIWAELSVTAGIAEFVLMVETGGAAGGFVGMHGVGNFMGGIGDYLDIFYTKSDTDWNFIRQGYENLFSLDPFSLGVSHPEWGAKAFYLTDAAIGLSGMLKEVPMCSKTFVKIKRHQVAPLIMERYGKTVSFAKNIQFSPKSGSIIATHDTFQIYLGTASGVEE